MRPALDKWCAARFACRLAGNLAFAVAAHFSTLDEAGPLDRLNMLQFRLLYHFLCKTASVNREFL